MVTTEQPTPEQCFIVPQPLTLSNHNKARAHNAVVSSGIVSSGIAPPPPPVQKLNALHLESYRVVVDTIAVEVNVIRTLWRVLRVSLECCLVGFQWLN